MTAVRLFHTELGDREAQTVLLVHGWGGDGREWSPHAEALSRRYHVVVPDLRGHGRSGVPPTGNTPRLMADDLARLIRGLGTGPVTAVGHSMGGQVVNLLAVHHPDLVRSVVALDPAHGSPTAELAMHRENLAAYVEQGSRRAADFVSGAFGPEAPCGLRAAHMRTVLGTPDHVIAEAYSGMYLAPDAVGSRPRSEAHLRMRRCRALTVWSAQEFAVWERTTTHVQGSRVDHWADTGHYVHAEHPDRTVRLIRAWVDAR
ncbi:alpha/beta hydrolase [Streptomyces phaeoluteigriseus]|uniref:Alpha/beta hydrolase n=1 Tax=Streptomyces phaeoluteigriseus TaxID=114686 RepID=A0ABY4ZCB7_9ACTN|nr:alpha/beta hydrolase [Streptomyces phaeoluteigriseus]USQ86193.1 alpha/beta hydrolase [Streptomyces phaeoluteigriseus]